MKKIIFGILILFVAVFHVNAKEIYYSDYSDFSEYTLEKIESSELINVETERRYRFYEKIEVGEFRTFLDDNSNFKFCDLNRKIDNSFSDWDTVEPSMVQNRIIEKKSFYNVRRPKKIKRISFMNTLAGSLKLNNIEIYYEDKKIEYELIFDRSDENLNINSLGTLTVDLKDYYDLQKIIVKIDSIDFKNTPEITVLASVPSNNNLYEIQYFSFNLMNTNNKNVVIEPKDWIRGNVQYENWELIDYKPLDEPLSITEEVIMYRYQDPAFYFYNTQQKYVDGYFKNYPGLTKDEHDYKDYYRYKTRDKIEVEEEIIINSYNQKLSDFITSTVDYTIETNLNINNNGNYKVSYKTPFITIQKNVLVEIDDNELKREIEKLKKENDNLNKVLNTLKQENNELNKDLNELKDKNKELNSSLQDMGYKNDNLNEELNILKQENYELDNNLDEMEQQNAIINKQFDEIKNNNKKLKEIITSLNKDNQKFCLKLDEMIQSNSKLQLEIQSNNDKYNKLLNDYGILEKSYKNIAAEKTLNDIACKQQLEEVNLKVDDRDKKLNLKEQTIKYLEDSLLKVNNKESIYIESNQIVWFILILIILLILLSIFLKKLSDKKKV